MLIAPAGIFVVDAKLYKGLIRLGRRGGLFSTDYRLFVGRRDCSHLAHNMGWQIEAVQRALSVVGVEPALPVTGVLCFVEGEWPLIGPPESFHGIRLEGTRSIKKMLASSAVLDPSAVSRLARALAAALPAN